MIQEIAFICYPVTDVARARQFYEQTLGLRLLVNFRDEWIEYDVGGVAFCITTMAEECKPGVGGAFVGFEVDDLDAELARLREAGVRFKGEPFTTPVCRMGIVLDPDGNTVVIHRRHSTAG